MNYVIATYNGYTKRNYNIPSPEDTLKIHLKCINKYKSIITQITIMKPKSTNFYKTYYNISEIVDNINIPIKIINCDNYGYSIGQWLKSYELSKDLFNYYIFLEDDYCPNIENFDKLLLDIYKRKFNSNIGLLCSVVEGRIDFNLSNKYYPLHFEGCVFVSKQTLQKLYSKWDNNTLKMLDKIDNKIEPNYNWSKIKKQYLGAYYQIAFSHMFTLSDIKHSDYLNEYYNNKILQTCVWHDHVKFISFYNNGNSTRKEYTLKDINNCPIIPIQLSDKISIQSNTKIKIKPPKIIFIIGMHRCGTSLLANYLVNNGFNIGKSINKDKNWQNPNGYFENDNFTEFHNYLLKYNNSSWCNIQKNEMIYTKDMVEKYRELIKQEFDNESFILIKDPRLTFFIKFLNEVCHNNYDKYFLFLTRNKEECINSLVKAQKIPKTKANILYNLTHTKYEDNFYKINHQDILFNTIKVLTKISSYCKFKLSYTKNIVDLSLYRNKYFKPVENYPYRLPLDIIPHIKPYIQNKTFCYLGCGEGDLLESIRLQNICKNVKGIDNKKRLTKIKVRYNKKRLTKIKGIDNKKRLTKINERPFIIHGDIFKNVQQLDCDVYFVWLGMSFQYEKLFKLFNKEIIIICGEGTHENQMKFKNNKGLTLIKIIEYSFDETRLSPPHPGFKLRGTRLFGVYKFTPNKMKKLKCLACILFHNDEDLVLEQLKYLTFNKHDIIVFDHNSTDKTLNIVNENINLINKVYNIPEKIPFKNNGVFKYISNILIKEYSKDYDWISFIESDEFLEGPDRSKSYYEHLIDIDKTKYDFLSFDNYIFWFTEKDDINKSVRERIKYYAYKKKCGVRYYAWRGKLQNIRKFNHNKVKGNLYPIPFKTCHYEMRSINQSKKKLKDRTNITSGRTNHHYNVMINKGVNNLIINSNNLHYDDGSELIKDNIFDWSKIY